MEGLEALRKKYPWPPSRPYEDLKEWSLDGGGKKLVIDLIRKHRVSLMVEIGAFMGGSAKIWLEANANLVLICVDPWKGDWWVEYGLRNGRERFASVFAKPDGPFSAFASLMWDFRDRIVPVKGRSPEVLEEIHRLGIKPDLFFLDSNKSGEELEVCERLFPKAIITGDDWTWEKDGTYPIRDAIRQFVKHRDFAVQTKDATWVLHRGPLSLTQSARLAFFDFVEVLRVFKRKHSGLLR